MHALLGLVLFDALFVDADDSWFAQAALVLTHVIQFVAAHGKVWFHVPTSLKDESILRFSHLDCG